MEDRARACDQIASSGVDGGLQLAVAGAQLLDGDGRAAGRSVALPRPDRSKRKGMSIDADAVEDLVEQRGLRPYIFSAKVTSCGTQVDVTLNRKVTSVNP